MMRLLLLPLFLISGPVLAGPVELDGVAVQGGLMQGRTLPGSEIVLDGRRVPQAPDGTFIIAFGRDARPVSELKISIGDGREEIRKIEVAVRDWEIQRIDGLPESKVSPRPEDLERAAAERALINAARMGIELHTWFQGGFVWPAEGRLSGVFGSQRILNGKPRNFHNGIDIAAPTGTPVRAAAAGRVSLVHPDMFYSGKTVIIDHGLGLNSVYIHMDKITVETGQMVDQGQTIGAIGATGRATGPHLHFGLAWFDVHIDPEPMLRKGD